MTIEFVDMFETLMNIIAQQCDFGKEWDTGTEYITVCDMWERAETLLREARGIT